MYFSMQLRYLRRELATAEDAAGVIARHVRELVEQQIADLGEKILITVAETGRKFLVPQHYIALHGIAGRDLAGMVGRFGIEEVAG